MIYRINVLEQRRKQKENCCGGNGPSCKCSSTPTPRQERRNSMVEFFETMKKNYISKK
jgi:hypothetical protein